MAHRERDSHGFLVERVVAHDGVRSELVPSIGGEYDDRVVFQPGPVEGAQNRSEITVAGRATGIESHQLIARGGFRRGRNVRPDVKIGHIAPLDESAAGRQGPFDVKRL